MKETNRNKITISEWAAALEATAVGDTVLPGFKTVGQIAKEIGRSIGHTGKLLSRAIEAGKVERLVFLIQRSNRMYPTPHYKIIEPR